MHLMGRLALVPEVHHARPPVPRRHPLRRPAPAVPGGGRLKAVEAAKRAAGPLVLTLPAIGSGEAWAVVAIVAILVLAVVWLSRDPNTEEVQTPVLNLKRRPGRGRSKKPRR